MLLFPTVNPMRFTSFLTILALCHQWALAVGIGTGPCNGHALLCNRKYSNVTFVAAHNSPFTKRHSLGRNQDLNVTRQLDDGVRMLQLQTHLKNGTVHMCHTSCDILDAGPLEDYLRAVKGWLDAHPREVVTVLIGNGDYVLPSNFTHPVENSKLIDLVYRPSSFDVTVSEWPTLQEMIDSNQRVVVMLDYDADFSRVPWLIDEFSVMWETQFSPTNRSFPCQPQRPEHRSAEDRNQRLFMINHNLNKQLLDVGELDLLIPAVGQIDQTNAAAGFGSVGKAVLICENEWRRPPNFILVDYFNRGKTPFSVPELVASINEVQWSPPVNGATRALTRSFLQWKGEWVGYAFVLAGTWMASC